ncbi:hypothetical protein CEXT_171841 [Caerostris extrusa]|uniref:Uncharacterized protein n=1 Tax=Caerostris extrusa TaxID=172846 RepID=A0AAV4V4W0_CAEEX|nr:hypothetical protein CEXT_171841 [Caerostris extrusa]
MVLPPTPLTKCLLTPPSPSRIKPIEIQSQIPSFAVDGQHGISYKLAFVPVSTFALDAKRISEITLWFSRTADCFVMIPAA